MERQRPTKPSERTCAFITRVRQTLESKQGRPLARLLSDAIPYGVVVRIHCSPLQLLFHLPLMLCTVGVIRGLVNLLLSLAKIWSTKKPGLSTSALRTDFQLRVAETKAAPRQVPERATTPPVARMFSRPRKLPFSLRSLPDPDSTRNRFVDMSYLGDQPM